MRRGTIRSATRPRRGEKILEHARLFSLAMHGASFLYNLLIAERYVEGGPHQDREPGGEVPRSPPGMGAECRSEDNGALSAWDRGAFWDLILAVNPRVGLAPAHFSAHGSTGSAALRSDQAADDNALRQLIARPGARPEGQPVPAHQRPAAGGLVRRVGHPPPDLPVGSGQQDRPGPARRAGGGYAAT